MTTQNRSATRPAHKVKLALIPVLAIVLAWLIWPRDNPSEPVTDPDPASPKAVPTIAAAAPESSIREKPLVAPVAWPQFNLSSTMAYDPFALPLALSRLMAPTEAALPDVELPTSFDGRVEEKRRQRLASLEQKRISAILIDDLGRSAVIDGQVLREGDLVEEGIRVNAIDADGVVFRIDETR
jgi:hypothetical protein